MRRLSFLFLFAPVLVSADVAYTLTPDPLGKEVRVSVTSEPGEDEVSFRIPAWSPGFYVILKYQDKIGGVRATAAGGNDLPVRRAPDNPRQWLVKNPSKGPVTLTYTVKGDDPGLGFFGVSVHPHTAFVHGPAAFMYVDGQLERPTTLRINNPEGWQTATSMDRAENGLFKARDYDELVDHPIRVGKFQKRTFTAAGVPFEVVYVSPNQQYNPDLDAETARLKKISETTIKLMGSAPFKRYVYHVQLSVGNFGGGLEHQASTVLAMPNRNPLNIDELAAHELYHVWDVKHIRPKVLGPFDYTKEVRTDNLWFAEGVTDYYAKLIVYRSGLNDAAGLGQRLASEIRTLHRSETRRTATLAQASRGAWEGGSQGTGDLSYYNKGQLVGMLLDAAIRARTGGKRSLDDVMRYMMERHRLPDKPGYEEDGILKAVNTVAGSDLTALYNRMVYSTEELPYEVMGQIGLRVRIPGQQYLDFGFTADDNGVVTNVTPGTQLVGLMRGDRIVAVNGKAYNGAPILKREGNVIMVRRGGTPVRLEIDAEMVTAQDFAVERDPFATPEAAKLADGWLAR